MNQIININEKYMQCINNSKKVEWHYEDDVLRGRHFNFTLPFLPSGLSLSSRVNFLNQQDHLFFSQVQGRTYAYMFGLVERFINAQVIDLSANKAITNQIQLEALMRFSAEELKHQQMFQAMEDAMEQKMPKGYIKTADSDQVASFVLSKSSWAVMALTAHIEIFVQAHYLESISPISVICPLWKDIFLFHWKDEAQHVPLDLLEWDAIDQSLSDVEREQAVEDLLELVIAVDGLLKVQAAADANYFLSNCTKQYSVEERLIIEATFFHAYRYQYIVSGLQIERFQEALFSKINDMQSKKLLSKLSFITLE